MKKGTFFRHVTPLALAALFAAFSAGCAEEPKAKDPTSASKAVTIRVESDPPGAHITTVGSQCDAPCDKLTVFEGMAVTAYMPSYWPAEQVGPFTEGQIVKFKMTPATKPSDIPTYPPSAASSTPPASPPPAPAQNSSLSVWAFDTDGKIDLVKQPKIRIRDTQPRLVLVPKGLTAGDVVRAGKNTVVEKASDNDLALYFVTPTGAKVGRPYPGSFMVNETEVTFEVTVVAP